MRRSGRLCAFTIVAALLVAPLSACAGRSKARGDEATPCVKAVGDSARLTELTDDQVALIEKVSPDSVEFASSVALERGDLMVAPGTSSGTVFRYVTSVSESSDGMIVQTCEPGGVVAAGRSSGSVDLGGGVGLSVPAGAFSTETAVRVARIAAPDAPPEVAQVPGLEPVSAGVVVVADGGAQPSRPVTLTLPVPEEAVHADDVGFVVVAMSADGTYDYFPTTVDRRSGVVSADVSHFTSFWTILVKISTFVDSIVTSTQKYLGLVHDPPGCYRSDQTYTVGGETYVISDVERDVAYLCLESGTGGTPTLTLSSNHGAAFRVTTTPEGVYTPLVGLDITGMIVQAIMNLIDPGGGQAPVLYSGATLDVSYPGGQVPSTVRLDVDPGPTLIASLLFGVTTMLTAFGVDLAIANVADIAQCAASTLEDGMEFTKDEVTAAAGTGFVRAAIDCFDAGADKIGISVLGQLVLGVIGSGVGLVSSGIAGVVSEINGSAHQTITISPSAQGTPAQSPGKPRTCPYPEPLSPAQLANAGASCAWGYTEYCDCV